ncbi:MAG TPA: ATP-binding cassette domain-containing protein [Candidatus Polarisedimenticolia bacterium]|nr:ATP-binding cassette domain-containing protein [Candidatus Polarisedimenticolia bacterium]
MPALEGGLVVQGRGVVKTFGDVRAVDGIDFAVRRGECFGMLGPNGAGKTSTVRMVHAASPLSAGELLVFGRDVAREPEAIKRRTGVCHQEDNLDPDFSVLKNLLVWARYFSIPLPEAAARASELLRFMELEEKSKVRIADLSGGMKRRLVLARALMNAPELLILDEPTTGLDPQARHQVWQRIQGLTRAGTTILLTTHYMEEAARLCDRLVIMDRGRIIVEGAPAELVRREIGEAVVEVIDPPPGVAALAGERGWRTERLADRLSVHTSRTEEVFGELAARFPESSRVVRMATLEDVFLKLTGRALRE